MTEEKSAVVAEVKAIDDRVSWIEKYAKEQPKRLQFFGVVDKSDDGYEIYMSPKEGIDGSGVYYQILRDNKGRVLKYHEEPDDGTGDWSQSEEYYFDDNGNTVMYEYYDAAFFQGECKYIPTGAIVRTIIKEYFAKDGRHINQIILTMRDREPFDFKLCGIDTKSPLDKIAKNYKSLREAARKKYSKYKWKKLWD